MTHNCQRCIFRRPCGPQRLQVHDRRRMKPLDTLCQAIQRLSRREIQRSRIPAESQTGVKPLQANCLPYRDSIEEEVADLYERLHFIGKTFDHWVRPGSGLVPVVAGVPCLTARHFSSPGPQSAYCGCASAGQAQTGLGLGLQHGNDKANSLPHHRLTWIN
jgi:hypothetical protein